MCKEKEIKGVLVDCEGINEETHPFNNPSDLKGAKYLFVGTFPPSRFISKDLKQYDVDWFYGSKDNAFWDLMGELFGDFSKNVEKRKRECKDLGIAFIDLFQVIKRYGGLSGDEDIFPIKITNLTYYLEENSSIEFVFFTSLWVEKIAKKEYLRLNRELLKENGKKTDYVEGGVFHRFKTEGKEVKFFVLPSPSFYNTDSYENKKRKWQEIFSSIGLQTKE